MVIKVYDGVDDFVEIPSDNEDFKRKFREVLEYLYKNEWIHEREYTELMEEVR